LIPSARGRPEINVTQTHVSPFQKCCQDFFGAHDKTLSVAIRATIEIVRRLESWLTPNLSSIQICGDCRHNFPLFHRLGRVYWIILADMAQGGIVPFRSG
jgi:hypothetical protein